jgi:hypothetical protein
MAFDKPCSGAKTLGREHSIWVFENDIDNLGIVPIPMKCFQK